MTAGDELATNRTRERAVRVSARDALNLDRFPKNAKNLKNDLSQMLRTPSLKIDS